MSPRDLIVMNVCPGRHDRLFLYVLFSGMIWLLAGCSSNERPGATPAPASPSSTSTEKKPDKGKRVTDYALKGILKKVDLARGSVTIAHEEIKGFMAAMTMPFFLVIALFFKELTPGDEVEGTLHVEDQDGVVDNYELRDLTVVKPALREMVLDVTKGKVSLAQTPRQLALGEAVPDFSMTTQEGKPLKLSDFEDMWLHLRLFILDVHFPISAL